MCSARTDDAARSQPSHDVEALKALALAMAEKLRTASGRIEVVIEPEELPEHARK